MKIAYSYSRVSSLEQIKGGGISRQLKLAKDYCQKHGYILDESTTFKEEGKTAFTGDNAETGKLSVILKLIAAGSIPKGSVLLVENLDRLARTEATAAMSLFLQIINAGITVVTLNDEKTYNKEAIANDPTSLLISLIYFIRSNDESKQKRIRITDSWRRKRIEDIEKGIKDRRNIPKWLKLEKNVFTPLPEKVKVVHRVFDLFLKDNLGIRTTSKKLNAEGVETMTGKKWTSCLVKFLLRNRSLIGEYQVGERVSRNVKKRTGKVVKDYYPSIIDREIFTQANNRFLLNPPKMGRPKVNTEDDWLTPLLKCAYCGGAVGAEHRKTSRTYVCWRSASGGGCVRCGIDRQWTQWAVNRVLRDSVREYVATLPMDRKIQDIEASLVEAKKEISNLVGLVAHGVQDAIQRVYARERDRKELEDRLAQLTAFRSAENVKITEETLAAVARRYISQVKVFFAGDESTKKIYAEAIKGKSGGYINKVIRPQIFERRFLEVYFNPPWEDRGWRVMHNWTTLPKGGFERFKVKTPAGH